MFSFRYSFTLLDFLMYGIADHRLSPRPNFTSKHVTESETKLDSDQLQFLVRSSLANATPIQQISRKADKLSQKHNIFSKGSIINLENICSFQIICSYSVTSYVLIQVLIQEVLARKLHLWTCAFVNKLVAARFPSLSLSDFNIPIWRAVRAHSHTQSQHACWDTWIALSSWGYLSWKELQMNAYRI